MLEKGLGKQGKLFSGFKTKFKRWRKELYVQSFKKLEEIRCVRVCIGKNFCIVIY